MSNSRRSKRVKQEPAGSGVADNEQIDDYERIRHENIQRNLQFLDSIGIQDVKSNIHQQQSTSSSRLSTKGLSTKRKTTSHVAQPPRRSGRVTIERLKKEIDESVATGSMDASQLELKRVELEAMVDDKAASTYNPSASIEDRAAQSRHSSDPISMLTPLNKPNLANSMEDLQWSSGLLSIIHTKSASRIPVSATPRVKCEERESQYRADLSALQLADADVAKVVPQRITAMVIHPSADRTLVIAGDKQGHVGFWNSDQGQAGASNRDSSTGVGGDDDGVFLFRPHVGSVSCLHVSPQAPGYLWSTSYDGTVRRSDVEQQAFVEAYTAPGDYDEVRFQDASFSSCGGQAFLGCSTGEVIALDVRSGSAGWTAQAHEGKINSIQVHPGHEHILVSASSGMGGLIAVHDMRKVGARSQAWAPLFTLNRHSKSINAAYLSPGTGEFLVSVSLDNTVSVWRDILKNGQNPVVTSFNHDNHTGRWLSTLKPAFDPWAEQSSLAAFVLGSLARPRRVEVYTLPAGSSHSSSKAATLGPAINLDSDNLASVCSRNCFHPSRRNVLAGGNSSGRVHLFR